jgi:sugar lactone lactonase YvrE
MTTLRSVASSLLAWSFLGLTARDAIGHPGSGIVVDAKGQVFFQDTAGWAIWKIDSHGRLSKYFDRMGGHWMALDAEGSFSRAKIPHFERITPDGEKPALVVAGGGSPITVNRDGNLYYLCGFSTSKPMDPGGPLIGRVSPEGKLTVLAPGLKETVERLSGITGLAAGPDGCLYAASPSAVLKIGPDGTASTVVHPVKVADCDEDFPDGNPNFPLPALRGLAVDPDGTIYAAATGCHRVVKIARDGKVEVVLKAERPWSPTGVAVYGGDVYVLEYTNANGGPADGWSPRVRKLARDGRVTTLATVPPRSRP